MTDKTVSMTAYHDSIEDALDWFEQVQEDDEGTNDMFLVSFQISANSSKNRPPYYTFATWSSNDPLEPPVGSPLFIGEFQ